MLGWGDVIFVGGSLVDKGGHNPIEPAAWSKPVLMGPHVENFDDIVAAFLEDDAILIVKDAADLRQKIEQLLSDDSFAREMGERARGVVHRHRGTAERYARRLLDRHGDRMVA